MIHQLHRFRNSVARRSIVASRQQIEWLLDFIHVSGTVLDSCGGQNDHISQVLGSCDGVKAITNDTLHQ
jgi:hypothetical protein